MRLLIKTKNMNEYIEVGNIRHFSKTENEDVLNFEVTEFDIRVIEVLLGIGVLYSISDEHFTCCFGRCKPVKLVVGILKEYIIDSEVNLLKYEDYYCTSGIPWSAIVSGECSLLDLEFSKI